MSGPRAILVADLGYGDGGKGTVVDHLTHANGADLIVRYNGGPQAGHNVVLPDGRHHTFSQFGSGLFHAGVRTLLAEAMLIEPYAMLNEAEHLRSIGVPNAVGRTTLDARCRVVTPPQQIANRVRERARGPAAHGTCGMGVGETVADSIRRPELVLYARHLADGPTVGDILRRLTAAKREELGSRLDHATADERRVFDDLRWIDVAVDLYGGLADTCTIASPDVVHAAVRDATCVIFEGAQGVLLDQHYGFAPHTTWSDTTFTHADALLTAAGFTGDVRRLGVLRTYLTRHGIGPLVTERAGLARPLPEPHNVSAGWQGKFRRGVIDLVALRYAIGALGDGVELGVTHLDRLADLPAVACDAYSIKGVHVESLTAPVSADQLRSATPRFRSWPTHDIDAFVAALKSSLAARVTLRSFGPTRDGKLP